MPTYEYQCDQCQHRFEEFQSFTAPKLTKCPACGAESLRRLFGTGAAILFKGSGFYETDYRSESYKSAEKKESDGSSSGASSNGTSESKPASGSSEGSSNTGGGTTTSSSSSDD